MIKGIPVLFFLITSIVQPVNSQDNLADSLKSKLKNAKNDSEKILMIGELCLYYINNDTTNAKNYCDLVIDEACKTTSLNSKAYSNYVAGCYYNVIADYNKSISYFKIALELYNKEPVKDSSGIGKTLYSYGKVFHFNGDFNIAILEYLKAESYLLKRKEYSTLVKLYGDIGDVYIKLNRMDKFSAYFEKVKSIIDFVKETDARSRSYIFTANMLVYQEKYDEAKIYFEKARKLAESGKRYNVLTTWAYSYGFMLSRQDKYDEALIYYTKSMGYARLFNSRYDECDAIYKIGLMHYYMLRFEQADNFLKQSLRIAEEIKSKILIRNALDALTYMEADRGNYKAAYTYLQRYVDTIYELFSEDDQKQVNFLNAKYEAAKKEAEIRQLRDEKRIQALEINERKNMIYMLLAILVTLVITIYFLRQHYLNKKKLNEQNLQIQQQKIRELEKEKQLFAVQYALEGEEKERSRIARDLHDGLGCLLSGAKMSFGSLKDSYKADSKEYESYKHSMEILSKSITELQRIAHNMMPQALLNSGLKDAVAEFCYNINLSSPVSVKFQFYGKENKLPHKYALAGYRIIQELINNILKHSCATEAIVQLVQEDERISIVVQDNGKGFDTSILKSGNGHGINNIRLRVEALDGFFELTSASGKGTEISIEFEKIK